MSAADQLQKARTCLKEKRFDTCFAITKSLWQNDEANTDAIELLAELMQELGHKDLAKSLRALIESSGVITTNARLLFEAGYHLIDTRQYELASVLLLRCLGSVDNDPVLLYELGFVFMMQKKYERAIEFLEKSFSLEPHFDTCLNLIACLSLSLKLKEVEKLIDKLLPLAENEEEVAAAKQQILTVKRLQAMSGSKLTERSWAYALYGTILLEQNGEGGKENWQTIGTRLSLLAEVVKTFAPEIEVVEYFNLKARPLAEYLAELLGISVESYKGPNRKTHALLVVADAKEMIGPHKVFSERQKERRIFANSVPAHEQLPVVPDIIGKLGSSELPWDNDNDLTDFKTSLANIRQGVKSIEVAEGKSVLEAIRTMPDALFLTDNSELTERPSYSAEIPHEHS